MSESNRNRSITIPTCGKGHHNNTFSIIVALSTYNNNAALIDLDCKKES